jgi:DNA mismatch endonuclease (patch repair protein)
MADIFSKEKRSEVMSLIKGKNTGPEREVFRFLRKEKIYFQKHYKRVPGSPDIALPRKKRAIFIDGGFWHGHDFEKRRVKLLQSEQYYWIEKIEKNMARDLRQREALRAAGWSILEVWEHDIKKKSVRGETFERIRLFLLEN